MTRGMFGTKGTVFWSSGGLTMDIASSESIILFDGDCNFCNSTVSFVLARERQATFRFAALQSPAGREILAGFGLPPAQLDTLVLIENGNAYERSTAALRIARHLRPPWPLLYACIAVPRVVRDAVYNRVARARHKLVSQKACRAWSAEERKRFLS